MNIPNEDHLVCPRMGPCGPLKMHSPRDQRLGLSSRGTCRRPDTPVDTVTGHQAWKRQRWKCFKSTLLSWPIYKARKRQHVHRSQYLSNILISLVTSPLTPPILPTLLLAPYRNICQNLTLIPPNLFLKRKFTAKIIKVSTHRSTNPKKSFVR